MNSITCKFKDIYEKDMDLLFLEEFVAEQEFVNLFLNQIGLSDAQVVEVEHSKTDAEYGESDMTIIVEKNGIRHALLIEDKIDAIAMPNQAQRYFARGESEVRNGEYEGFDVFIIAPKKYLNENGEAKRYPYQVTYEEVALFFEKRKDLRSQFKFQQIMQAICKQKNGYQVKENKNVTEFWDAYIDYQKKYYPSLWLISSKGAKGAKASWARYRTVLKTCPIYHKCEKGFVDLNFTGLGDEIVQLEQNLKMKLGEFEKEELILVRTHKSAALRIVVPELNVQAPFEKCLDCIDKCFQAVEKLSEVAKRLNI